jgi:purine-nucleoside phosphorylase
MWLERIYKDFFQENEKLHSMKTYYNKVQEALAFIRDKTDLVPTTGVILGTGLNAFADSLVVGALIPYENIPHFPVSTLGFHKGNLIIGELEGSTVVVMQGRFHYYEGYSMKEITFPVRVMREMGIQNLLISNAAGGLDPDHKTSDLMVLTDHINLQPANPLIGENIETWGPRFPDMSEPYDPDLIFKSQEVASRLDIKLKYGTYASVSGPNLETKAEYRYLRIIGADAVGMSTVPEVIVANHMGLNVFAISVITDLCSPGKIRKVEVSDILDAASKAEPKLVTLFGSLIKQLSE